MNNTALHLAQINVARMKFPLEAVEMKEFYDFLGPINQLAESSPGFVWRLKDEEGTSAVNIETPFPNDMMIVNMSVWKDITTLREFVYNTVHSYFVKSRKRWFEQMNRPHTALWYVPVGHEPTLEEAKTKLEQIERHGPTAAAFLPMKAFGPDGRPLQRITGGGKKL